MIAFIGGIHLKTILNIYFDYRYFTLVVRMLAPLRLSWFDIFVHYSFFQKTSLLGISH